MKLIFFESQHIEEHPIKILKLDLIPIIPSNSMKLSLVQTGLAQGSPEGPTYRVYNSRSAYANEMQLRNKNLFCYLYIDIGLV